MDFINIKLVFAAGILIGAVVFLVSAAAVDPDLGHMPPFTVNGKTNIWSDDGTSPLFNGSAIGVQTPWSKDINAAGFNLTNLPSITGGTNGIAIYPGSGNPKIRMFQSSMDTDPEWLYVRPKNNVTQSANTYGIRVDYELDNGNTSHSFANGAVLGELFIPSSNNQNYTARTHGLYGYLHHEGAGKLSDARGVYLVTGNYGTGTISDAYGAYIEGVQAPSVSGTITNWRGVYIANYITNSTAPVPSFVAGVQSVIQPGVATNAFHFYATADVPSVFGGIVTGKVFYANTTITSGNTTDGSGDMTGVIQIPGGGSFTKTLYVGKHLLFPATATDNTVGLAFGTETYIYRFGSGNIRIDGELYVGGDIYPGTTATYDVGSASRKWRNANFSSTVNSVAFSGGTFVSTNGVGSLATGTITTSATGATNTLTVNVVLYVTAATGASLTDNAGTTEFSGVTISGFTPIRLQPNGKFVGTSITYATGASSHAW